MTRSYPWRVTTDTPRGTVVRLRFGTNGFPSGMLAELVWVVDKTATVMIGHDDSQEFPVAVLEVVR